jgi:hypothetical protein
MQMLKLIKSYLLVLVLLTRSLGAFAQVPPTGGPNPSPTPPPPGFPTVLYPVMGFVASATSYYIGYYVKNKSAPDILIKFGHQIPVNTFLASYLLRQGILPTPDAFNLMYALNPILKPGKMIRQKQKMVNPDFPKRPISSISPVPITAPFLAELEEQINMFKTNLITFQCANIAIKPTNLNAEKINFTLKGIEKSITAYEDKKEEANTVKSQLITDLLHVLNQTLNQNITSQTLSDSDAALMADILGDLTELLSPAFNNNLNPDKRSQLYLNDKPENEIKLYAWLNTNPAVSVGRDFETNALSQSLSGLVNSGNATNTVESANANLLQGFAFAIYKLKPSGVPITKGPEVESQYFIQYVLPALKSFPDSYHTLSPPLASYASTYLPPAKFFIIVKDINGNQLLLQNPLIDTKDAFRNPHQERVKGMIVIPIYVTK